MQDLVMPGLQVLQPRGKVKIGHRRIRNKGENEVDKREMMKSDKMSQNEVRLRVNNIVPDVVMSEADDLVTDLRRNKTVRRKVLGPILPQEEVEEQELENSVVVFPDIKKTKRRRLKGPYRLDGPANKYGDGVIKNNSHMLTLPNIWKSKAVRRKLLEPFRTDGDEGALKKHNVRVTVLQANTDSLRENEKSREEEDKTEDIFLARPAPLRRLPFVER